MDMSARRHDTKGPGRAAAWGLVMLLVLVALACLGPLCLNVDPAAQSLSDSLLPPGGGEGLGAGLLGRDVLGRDVLARLMEASRLSLGLAALCAASAGLPGVLAGVAAAWWQGPVDRGLLWLSDVLMSLPGLLLVLLLATIAPGQAWALYLGVSITLWVECFRVTRATVRPVLAGDGVEAAGLLGLGPWHVLRHHVWPVLAPVAGTLFALGTAQAVLATATLGFIGVGLQPPTPELGLMMTEFLPYYEEAPWLMAAPVVVLVWLVLAMSLLMPRLQATNGAEP
jgi:peptide/nickel transport system permease protein